MKKVVIVTGSSKGIGAATIKYYANNNYNVVINYNHSLDDAQKLYDEVSKITDAILVQADISKEEDVKKLMDETIKAFGRIDTLVNNAGIAIDTTLEDKTVENFRRIIDVNLIGTFLTCKHIGTYMKEQGTGSIINISSTNGLDSYYPYSMDYDASKAGVISLSHNFALLYAPKVRVNTICPGWVNTEMNKELDDDYKKEECKHILLNRFAEPEEIAKTIYETDNNLYLNDSIIKVDGGRC
jgi:3-oxoacyl-[acyl-carrier protein] reductase